jgi:hypothetical protein
MHRSLARILCDGCEHSTERLRALRAAPRSLSLSPPRGGSVAQAAGLGEPSVRPQSSNPVVTPSIGPHSDARLCACMRAQVRPSTARDGSTASARRPPSPRSPSRPSPPSAASPPPAATARARCAPRAKNRNDACVHASQLPRAPPAATAAASALPQPSVHATHGLTRLVRAALAVVRAADVSPTRRR